MRNLLFPLKIDSFIDSFSVRMPLEHITNLPTSLTDTIYHVSETGEILDTKISKIFLKLSGVTYRAYVVNLFGKEYLEFILNTKMLGSDYFLGISKTTLPLLLANFKKVTRINFSDSDFQKAIVFDVDFAFDFVMSDEHFHKLLSPLSSIQFSRKFLSKNRFYFDKKMIIGLQFLNRKDATVTHPFVKFYDKNEELITRSEDFFKSFNIKLFENRKRLEVTVRNSQHFASFGFKEPINRIDKLFNLDFDWIIFKLLDKHTLFTSVALEYVKVKKICTPSDWFILELMDVLMEDGQGMAQIFGLLDKYPAKTKNWSSQRSRIVSRLKDSYLHFKKMNRLNDLKVTLNDAFKVSD